MFHRAAAFLISISLFSCGPGFRPVDVETAAPEKVTVANTDVPPADPPAQIPSAERPLTLPGTPEKMAGRSYQVRNKFQSFTLVSLGEHFADRWECQATLKLEEKDVVGVLEFGFAPALTMTFRSGSLADVNLVSGTEVCGERTMFNKSHRMAKGSLVKRAEDNRFILNFNLDSPDPILLSLAWTAAANGDGDLICRTASNEILHQGRLSGCHVRPAK